MKWTPSKVRGSTASNEASSAPIVMTEVAEIPITVRDSVVLEYEIAVVDDQFVVWEGGEVVIW